MLPLVRYLSRRGRNRLHRTQGSNLAFVEGIATRRCFGMDCRKIGVDCTARQCMCPKALQLRMVPVASCFPTQYRPSQQRFAPQCNQALGIKVLRMNCPESHIPMAPNDEVE